MQKVSHESKRSPNTGVGFLRMCRSFIQMLSAGIPLKSYGCRTMVGNWFEERISLEAHLPKSRGVRPAVRDLDVDVHVMAAETSPKWRQDEPPEARTTYQAMTDRAWLDGGARLARRAQTAEVRRRLEGSAALRQVSVAGSTATPRWLSTQFHDPHKTRFRSVYARDYGRPEWEAASRAAAAQTVADTPRRLWTDGTWTPGWAASNK
jgi:hypothetical protein